MWRAQGLGKTIQVIAMLAYLVEARGQPGPFMVAAPSSLIANWEKEFAAWAPSLQLLVYRGTPAEREAMFRAKASQKYLLSGAEVLAGRFCGPTHKCPQLTQEAQLHRCRASAARGTCC